MPLRARALKRTPVRLKHVLDGTVLFLERQTFFVPNPLSIPEAAQDKAVNEYVRGAFFRAEALHHSLRLREDRLGVVLDCFGDGAVWAKWLFYSLDNGGVIQLAEDRLPARNATN